MRRLNLSVSGLSTSLAMLLALWEIYFFFFAGSTGSLGGTLGFFTPDRLGFNMAWLTLLYLAYQLISIPFSLPTAGHRFIGVVDGMASLIPLVIVLVVVLALAFAVASATYSQVRARATTQSADRHRAPIRRCVR